MMTKTVHGIVRGSTIEFAEELGVAEGRAVEVQVTVIEPATTWGEGLRRCAGALAIDWSDEDDRILTEIHEERQHDCRRELSE